MSADFIAYMRAVIKGPEDWWPETLLYASSRHSGAAFELFARAKSKRYFDRVKGMLGISNKEELEGVLKQLQDNPRSLPSWQYNRLSPMALMGYQQLATVP